MESVTELPENCSQFAGRTAGKPMYAVPPDARLSRITRVVSNQLELERNGRDSSGVAR